MRAEQLITSKKCSIKVPKKCRPSIYAVLNDRAHIWYLWLRKLCWFYKRNPPKKIKMPIISALCSRVAKLEFFWQIVPAHPKKKVKWNITSFWHTTYKYMCLSPWYFWPSRFKVHTIWRSSNCLCSMFGIGRRIRVRVSSVGTQRNTIPNHVKLDWILFFRHEFYKNILIL